jgi:hypothetical protein
VGKKRLARRADNLAAICEPNASNSHNPKVLHGLYKVSFTFLPIWAYKGGNDNTMENAAQGQPL